jgi:phosphoribosylglycinamide formyltransferase-1
MTTRARVAVFISGSGTNMAALLYASRLPGLPVRDRPRALEQS